MSLTADYSIADFPVRITIDDTRLNTPQIIDSFEPFRVSASVDDPLLTMIVDDRLRPVSKDRRERIDTYDTGNGRTRVDRLNDGGLQFIVRDVYDHDCCLMQTDADYRHCRCALNGDINMRRYGLNSALMMAFTFATSSRSAVMMHAALIRHQGKAYAFIAKSGTGKSTHAAMWMRAIPGCDLMNDDNPIIRIIDNKPVVYGSPWSGKTPCYRQTHAPLGAIVRIERAIENRLEHLGTLDAFASLLPSCSAMRWDTAVFDNICKTLTELVATDRLFIMHCLPNEDAARTCFEELKVES